MCGTPAIIVIADPTETKKYWLDSVRADDDRYHGVLASVKVDVLRPLLALEAPRPSINTLITREVNHARLGT